MKNIIIIKSAFLFVVLMNAMVDISHKVLLQNIAFKIFDGSEQVIWTSIINAMIIIPFLILFTTSGYLSDKYDKKNILIYGALSSFTLSVLMIVSYISANYYFAMFVLILLAIQSAIYSPAKFGIVISIYGKDNLAKGNSHLQAITIMAMLLAMALTSYLFEAFYINNNLDILNTKESLLQAITPLTYYVIPLAFLELLVSFMILKNLKSDFKTKDMSLNTNDLIKGKLLMQNIKSIISKKVIFFSVIGLSVFWAISQGLIVVFPAYAKEYINITSTFEINMIIAASGLGIALGSYLYSKLSKHYIELGTIPIASIGMAFAIYLSISFQTPLTLAFSFFIFGLFGGMFIVPLNSLIQFNAKKEILGTVLAGNNWFQSLAMFLMLCFTTFASLYALNPLYSIYAILLVTIIGTSYTIYKLPQTMILMFLKLVVGLKYKLSIKGISNIPSTGGVLLLGNHVSWIDWAIILMSTPREVRFVMEKAIYEKWYINWLLKIFNAIPISSASSKSTMQDVAKALDEGHIVVLFPEGAITRNGHLGEFKKGFEKILELTNNDVKVVSFYIKGLWESMFSRANKKVQKSNKTNNVIVVFSKVMNKEDANIVSVKNEVINLSSLAWDVHIKSLGTVCQEIFNSSKNFANRLLFADSTGVELSGNKFLTVSILFKNLFQKKVQGQNIGILMPSTAAGAFINTSVLMLGKTAVNINYTSSLESVKHSIEQAQIKTIIASKKFIAKLEAKGILINEVLDIVDVIYVEDVKNDISKVSSLITFLSVKILPVFILKLMHIKKTKKDDTTLILFSSGSEGNPKGIELSSDNILGNSLQTATVLNATNNDTILGSLPLFHAFGIVVTTFLPLIEGIKCVAHPDPTDGLGIGKLVAKYEATIMCGTSTFFRLYTKNKKVNPLMFSSLRLVVAGAEKLREDIRIAFKEKFGKDILEGFGTTETTPVATCNLPDVLSPQFTVQKGFKVGTVGMPIPGTYIKIVNPDTFEELETAQEGMIIVSGIQVMKGYLNNSEKTAEVLKNIDGKIYYITGDKGRVDTDGFLTIVDRYSRFAKLGGEMISMGSIESNILEVIKKIDTNLNDVDLIATSLEDEKKGEKIILLIANVDDEFIIKLKEHIIKSFDNKLMIPSEIKIVEEIPKLGSGKKDFKAAKILAST
jgi:acyl-[acyl-carrier-protein]-phospholipid O-acyltransferase/long-chain-fatty-acid--[acyl-carrier-protein] ligase